MPKSNINAPMRFGRELQEDGSWVDIPPEPVRRVSVGWAKGTHVQVGIGWVDETPKVINTTGNATAAGLTSSGRYSLDYLNSGETDEAGKVWLSQWCDMDRHTINQLIRDLRKARDEAFGRDE